MDIADQVRLTRNRNEIRETVIFKYIAAYLLQDQVINSEEFQLIAVNQTKQAQMDALMELLPSKGHEAFLSFISSLDEDYHWLAQNLRKKVSAQDISSYQHNIQNKMCSSDQNDNLISCESEQKEITIDMINILQQNARLVRRWTTLAYRLGLDRQAQSIKVRVNMNCEDLDQCLTYLIQDWSSIKPRDANLGNLVRALKAESFNDVAVQLETKFY